MAERPFLSPQEGLEFIRDHLQQRERVQDLVGEADRPANNPAPGGERPAAEAAPQVQAPYQLRQTPGMGLRGVRGLAVQPAPAAAAGAGAGAAPAMPGGGQMAPMGAGFQQRAGQMMGMMGGGG